MEDKKRTLAECEELYRRRRMSERPGRDTDSLLQSLGNIGHRVRCSHAGQCADARGGDDLTRVDRDWESRSRASDQMLNSSIVIRNSDHEIPFEVFGPHNGVLPPAVHATR